MHALVLQAWIERLITPQGRNAGAVFTLFPWELDVLRALEQAAGDLAVTMARGNGKTSFFSALASAAVTGPLVQRGAETVVCASSFEQGLVLYKHTLAMLAPWLEDDPRRYRVNNSTNRANIVDKRTGAGLYVLGSDPKRLHGHAPVLVLADEPAQWPVGTRDAMLAALETSLGKIPESRMVQLGTRPATSGHPFALALKGSKFVWAAPDRLNPFRRAAWLRANPSLPYMPDLEARIRLEAKAAKTDPAKLASFRALRLNQGVSDTIESFVYDPRKWEALEGEAPRVGRTVWGVDLGTSAAQSAIACYWPDTGRLEVISAFPELPSLEHRGLADGVGPLYTRCWERGELLLLGSRISDVGALLREAYERWGPPSLVVCDDWRYKELQQSLEQSPIPPCAVEKRRMGPKDGGEDMRDFRAACDSGAVTPTPSLLLRSALLEARTVGDNSGNEKLAKNSEGGRRGMARDDAIAAGILGVSAGYRRKSASPARGPQLVVV